MKQTLLATILLGVVFTCTASVALAQPVGVGQTGNTTVGTGNTGPTNPPVRLINPLGAETDLMGLINKILDFVIRIGAIVVTFMLVFVGFKFVTARGAPTKIEEAKKNLLWTLIGALILLGAKAIALGVEATVRSLSSGS